MSEREPKKHDFVTDRSTSEIVLGASGLICTGILSFDEQASQNFIETIEDSVLVNEKVVNVDLDIPPTAAIALVVGSFGFMLAHGIKTKLER